MLCLLGTPSCGVVCSFPLKVELGSVVRVSSGNSLEVLRGGGMIGYTYRIISESRETWSYRGKKIPIFGVRIQEDEE